MKYIRIFIACLFFANPSEAGLQELEFRVLPGNTKLTVIDIAIQVTDHAKRTSPVEDFICQTWVITKPARSIHNQFPDDDVSNTLSNTAMDDLYPIVLQMNDNVDPSTYYDYFNTSIPASEQKTDNKRRFTYTDYEFEDDDLINGNMLGVMRHGVNCMSVFVVGGSSIHETYYLATRAIEMKLARPHRDYFFYTVGLEASDNEARTSEQTIEEILWKKMEMAEIRHKYVLHFNSPTIGSIPTGDASRTLTAALHNVCQTPNGGPISLFSKTCFTHIMNRHYKITSCYITPFVRYENNPDGSRKWGAGIIFFMFEEASFRYNFTFDIKYAGFSGSSGFKKKDTGVWFGAVGEVFKREADIAFSVGITIHRHYIVDPSMGQTWITRVFFIRTPSLKTSWGSIFWPMELHIWVLTIITILLVLPVYYWAAVLYFRAQARNGGSVKPPYLFWEVADVLNRILMEQSATARPWKGNRIRLLIFLWAGFCLVLETGYRSNLVSFLTFLEREDIPKTHMELSKSNYKLFFRTYNGVAHQFTANSPDPMHKRILQKSTLSNHSHDCIHSALLTDKSACLDYRLNGQFAISQNATLVHNLNSEVLVLSKDTDFTCNIVWAFRKGSPWTPSFDKVILNSLAAGLYNKWKDNDWAKSRIEGSAYLRSDEESPVRQKIESIMAEMNIGPKALNNESLQGTYIIFMGGILISFLGWVAEHVSSFIASYKLNQEKKRQMNNIRLIRRTLKY